jgi:hypothetical protein
MSNKEQPSGGQHTTTLSFVSIFVVTSLAVIIGLSAVTFNTVQNINDKLQVPVPELTDSAKGLTNSPGYGPAISVTTAVTTGAKKLNRMKEVLELDSRGAIPIATMGKYPVTEVTTVNGKPQILIVDTGSSEISFCGNPGGDLTPLKKYGCGSYGTGFYGWKGKFYEGYLLSGYTGSKVMPPVKSAIPLEFAVFDPGSTCIFKPYGANGIAGVNNGLTLAQTVPYAKAPSSSHNGCEKGVDSKAMPVPAQFAKDLGSVGANQHTFSFINLNLHNNEPAVVAFGDSAASFRQLYAQRAATVPLVSVSQQQEMQQKKTSFWLCLNGTFTYEFFNVPGCSEASPCRAVYNPSSLPTSPDKLILDSGTPSVNIPLAVMEEVFGSKADGLSYGSNLWPVYECYLGVAPCPSAPLGFTEDSYFTITMGTADAQNKLTFTMQDFEILPGTSFLQVQGSEKYGEPYGVLGFPVFLKYDVEINSNPSTGFASFYSR